MANEKSAEGKTVQEVVDSMTEEQKNVLYFLVGLEKKKAEANNAEAKHSDLEGDEEMKYNAFENDVNMQDDVLAHSGIDAATFMSDAIADAKRYGSLKESILEHAGTYGIDDIDVLFPDAKAITSTPEFLKRETAWVAKVMNGTKHTPFARIKTQFANITESEARAKGYVKGNLKTEEVISLLKRATDPQTVYKKQKLDRDDIIDITDFDVVAWLKGFIIPGVILLLSSFCLR